MMNSIGFRRLAPGDIPGAVALVNRTGFGRPLTTQSWEAMEAKNHVTFLAQDDDRLVGAIPFVLRDFIVAPGVAVRTAFAHMVCVDSLHRGRGLGSRLMAWAFEELAGICDLACVYTGCEGHSPYRFYERAGFYDLLYVYRYDGLPESQADMRGLQLFAPEETEALDSELLRCFSSCYPYHAGFPRREAGFWTGALQSIIFEQGPVSIGVLVLRLGGQVQGYALLARERSLLKILELAALDADECLTHRLLQGAGKIAQERGLEDVAIYCSAKDPLVGIVEQQGWQRGSREVRPNPLDAADPDVWEQHRIVAGRVLNIERFVHKTWPTDDASEKVSLRVWTPGTGPVVLHSSSLNQKMVNLEMKEETLHRLILRRLGLHQCIEAELVTVQSGTERDVDYVAQHFSPVPWTYFELDYI